MSEVVELRQYTLHSGQRDVLAGIFLRHFVDSQEAVGMRILGVYYDLDREDRFVWMRSFPDMAARRAALTRFYFESEAWRRYGPAANATMVDSSDVLLLRPLTELTVPKVPRLVATIQPSETTMPCVEAALRLETNPAENDFPQLPVRTDGPWLVWLNGFETDAETQAYLDALRLPREWSIRLAPAPEPPRQA
jgi:NIPSNAP